VEPDQVDVIAAAVLRDAQQIIHAVEPRLAGQIVGDVAQGDRNNRIDDDVAIVHLITATGLDMGARPDANTASDSAASDAFAKALGEHHEHLNRAIKPV
jgi:hypothetical protein